MKVAAMNQESLAISGTLGALAANTGGSFLHDTNDFDAALHRLASAPEYTYLLGFKPSKLDGHFHPLKVTLTARHDLDLQARSQYFAARP